MHTTFWVTADWSGTWKEQEGILESRRSGEEGGPMGVAACAPIFVPRVERTTEGPLNKVGGCEPASVLGDRVLVRWA